MTEPIPDPLAERARSAPGPGPATVPAHTSAMLAEVRDGMSRPQKELSPKFFYDHRGSELFEQITRLAEYYLTRTERALLERWMSGWMEALRPRSLVELGAGSAAKTRTVLDAMRAHHGAPTYVPVDVSEEFLHATVAALRSEYPELVVRPAVADIAAEFTLADGLPRPVLFAFLGSTIGNFAPPAATRLLRQLRAAMQPGDRFLLGVDLRKDVATIEAAYNDGAGVTAEFNRNMLRVLNRELGADFDPEAFDHRAVYNREDHCVEMHLVAREAQRVSVPGAGSWAVAAGESIRTEISCKHDRGSVSAMLGQARLAVERWETDADGRYAILLGSPVP